MKNERVRFYSVRSCSNCLTKLEILTPPEYSDLDVNDAIEFYQIKQCFDHGACSNKWTAEQFLFYKQKCKKLYGLTMQYFKSLTDNTILQIYSDTIRDYIHAFWELFNNCKLYENISASAFDEVLHKTRVFPNDIFKYKSIVNQYGSVLRNYLLENISRINIIIAAYEQNYKSDCDKLFLPEEFTGKDICDYFERYIESSEAIPQVLQSISRIVPSDKFPIPPELRLKAKREYEKRIKEKTNNFTMVSYGITLSLSKTQDEELTFDTTDSEIHITYGTKWLLESLDFPSILNNYLYLFDFADVPQMRCNLVSTRSDSEAIEILLSPRLKCDYPDRSSFHLKIQMALLQMSAYYSFLNSHGIRYENVLHWFFTEYLQLEFGCPEIRLSFPSIGSTYAEKCALICTTFDSAIKQFSLFAKNKEIDFDLVSFTSASPPFDQIPSLVKNKYILGTGKEYKWLSFIMFSDQCIYSFNSRVCSEATQYASLFDLLNTEDVFLSDYQSKEYDAFYHLEKMDIVTISPDGKITLGNSIKIEILKDLYYNEVISRYHYPKEAESVFQNWIDEGILSERDGLLSKPEVDFFNYLLNRSEFFNSLDIRNKYIHGVQHVNLNEEDHIRNYYLLLIVFTILVIKINDDFCLYFED